MRLASPRTRLRSCRNPIVEGDRTNREQTRTFFKRCFRTPCLPFTPNWRPQRLPARHSRMQQYSIGPSGKNRLQGEEPRDYAVNPVLVPFSGVAISFSRLHLRSRRIYCKCEIWHSGPQAAVARSRPLYRSRPLAEVLHARPDFLMPGGKRPWHELPAAILSRLSSQRWSSSAWGHSGPTFRGDAKQGLTFLPSPIYRQTLT